MNMFGPECPPLSTLALVCLLSEAEALLFPVFPSYMAESAPGIT